MTERRRRAELLLYLAQLGALDWKELDEMTNEPSEHDKEVAARREAGINRAWEAATWTQDERAKREAVAREAKERAVYEAEQAAAPERYVASPPLAPSPHQRAIDKLNELSTRYSEALERGQHLDETTTVAPGHGFNYGHVRALIELLEMAGTHTRIPNVREHQALRHELENTIAQHVVALERIKKATDQIRSFMDSNNPANGMGARSDDCVFITAALMQTLLPLRTKPAGYPRVTVGVWPNEVDRWQIGQLVKRDGAAFTFGNERDYDGHVSEIDRIAERVTITLDGEAASE